MQGPTSSPLHKPMTNKTKSPVSNKSAVLKGVDPKLAQIVMDEVLENSSPVQWDDIAGQQVIIFTIWIEMWLLLYSTPFYANRCYVGFILDCQYTILDCADTVFSD